MEFSSGACAALIDVGPTGIAPQHPPRRRIRRLRDDDAADYSTTIAAQETPAIDLGSEYYRTGGRGASPRPRRLGRRPRPVRTTSRTGSSSSRNAPSTYSTPRAVSEVHRRGRRAICQDVLTIQLHRTELSVGSGRDPRRHLGGSTTRPVDGRGLSVSLYEKFLLTGSGESVIPSSR